MCERDPGRALDRINQKASLYLISLPPIAIFDCEIEMSQHPAPFSPAACLISCNHGRCRNLGIHVQGNVKSRIQRVVLPKL